VAADDQEKPSYQEDSYQFNIGKRQVSIHIWIKKKKKFSVHNVPLTFSIKDTTMFAKHGKVGTRGFKVIRGAANICKSTN
jgi:hypothetical protein